MRTKRLKGRNAAGRMDRQIRKKPEGSRQQNRITRIVSAAQYRADTLIAPNGHRYNSLQRPNPINIFLCIFENSIQLIFHIK